MYPDIFVCENPGDDKNIATKLIYISYLENISEVVLGEYNRNIEINNSFVNRNIIISVNLNRVPQQNSNEINQKYIDIFCKYVYCGLCIFIDEAFNLLHLNGIKKRIIFIVISFL